MTIPVEGQGERLPEGFPYKGYWIHKPRIFLYLSDLPLPDDMSTPQFLAEVNPRSDDWSFGFDVRALADGFQNTVQAIIDANIRGLLVLKQVASNTPDGENDTVRKYTFGLFAREITITVENLSQAGRG